MEVSFTHLGNHLISDSAATIKAGDNDDLSAIDPDETLLYGRGGGPGQIGSGRRRHDDDDNETEVYDDEDDESLASVPIEGMRGVRLNDPEEENQLQKLPEHACALVPGKLLIYRF